MSESIRVSVTYDRLRKGDVVVTPEHATVWVDRPIEPVPALPTEPGYYLANDGSVYRLDTAEEEPVWDDTFGNPQDEIDLIQIIPFRLIEPRAVTAKVVLDRVWDQLGVDDALIYSMLAREFGVSS